MLKTDKICVVGAGRWGKNHIRTLFEMESLGAIVESNEENLAKIESEYPSINVYSQVSMALKTKKYKGYIIATPAETHFKIAKEIIINRCHVLVEKPITLIKEDAIKLKELSEKYQVNLMVGHILLFHPAIIKIKQLIDLKIIGDLQYIYSNRLNLGTIRTNENVFWSLAPHDISIFQYILESKPMKITSIGSAYLQKSIHDTTLTVFEYSNNIKAHIFVSWLHPFKEHRLVIVGSNGMISFEDSKDSKPLKLYSKSYDMRKGYPEKKDGPVELISYEKTSPLENELRYFIDHMDEKNIGIANAQDAIDVVDILIKSSDSLINGKGIIIE